MTSNIIEAAERFNRKLEASSEARREAVKRARAAIMPKRLPPAHDTIPETA